MKIEVGLKCTQIKVIEEYGFDYIGEEFMITKVTDMVVMGKGITMGVGFGIEREKFDTYFEVSEVENNVQSLEVTEVDGQKVIRNGRVTIVILSDGCKGISKCLPEDRYDSELGYQIAFTRAKIKSFNKELKKLVI